MNILALDTSSRSLSLALCAGEETFAFDASCPGRHAELIVKATDTLLDLAGLRKTDLDAALVMEGPGSFTGLRIAFSAAKALSLALAVKCAACPTLDVLAWPHRAWSGLVVPLLDAGGGAGKDGSRVFAALYRDGKRLTPYMDDFAANIQGVIEKSLGEHGEKESVLLTGSAAPFLPGGYLVSPDYQTGHALALLSFARQTGVLEGETSPLSAPVYLRKSSPEEKEG